MKLFFSGMITGIVSVLIVIGYWTKKEEKNYRVDSARNTIYALKYEAWEQTNAIIESFHFDSMSDDSLLNFTEQRAREYRKRFVEFPATIDGLQSRIPNGRDSGRSE